MYIVSFGCVNSFYVCVDMSNDIIVEMVCLQDVDIFFNSRGFFVVVVVGSNCVLCMEVMLYGILIIMVEYGNLQVYQLDMIECGIFGVN